VLAASPHGVDLGPLLPCLPARLKFRRKTIDLAPQPFVDDLARLRKEVAREARGSLELIGRRHPRSNNSWMHNTAKLMAGKPICTLLIHPDDARTRNVSQGARVTVRSNTGDIELEAEISDAVMPGVVSMPHGFGHSRPGVRLAIASSHAGASFNDLTDNDAIDALSGNAVLSGIAVTVEPAPTKA